MSLRGRVAIVTGASRGLGKVIASTLVREGASVMMTARDADVLRTAGADVAAGCVGPDQHVLWETADVSSAVDVDRLVQRTMEELGRLDVLVCNAGVHGALGPVDEVDWDAWVKAIEVNLFGTVHCCRAAVTIMRRQGGGKIVVLGGGGATSPLPRFSAYAASKAAVVRFAETLAEEVKESGIDVNTVAPGALNTRLLDEVLAAGPDRVGAQYYERVRGWKSGGGASPQQAADLVAFLASAESDGISGRLIAAVWDDWRSLPAQRERLAGSDVYTLRRILPEDRGWTTPS